MMFLLKGYIEMRWPDPKTYFQTPVLTLQNIIVFADGLHVCKKTEKKNDINCYS